MHNRQLLYPRLTKVYDMTCVAIYSCLIPIYHNPVIVPTTCAISDRNQCVAISIIVILLDKTRVYNHYKWNFRVASISTDWKDYLPLNKFQCIETSFRIRYIEHVVCGKQNRNCCSKIACFKSMPINDDKTAASIEHVISWKCNMSSRPHFKQLSHKKLFTVGLTKY